MIAEKDYQIEVPVDVSMYTTYGDGIIVPTEDWLEAEISQKAIDAAVQKFKELIETYATEEAIEQVKQEL